MPVVYDSRALIPAPLFNISKQYLLKGDGEKIGAVYNITLTGTLVAHRGSPTSFGGRGMFTDPTTITAAFYAGSFASTLADEVIPHDSRLGAIIKKQGSLRQLFKEEGRILEIIPLDGSTPLSCNPRVVDIVFSEGVWVDRCDYTISLEADTIRYAGVDVSEDVFSADGQVVYLSEASESWTIEQEDELLNHDGDMSYRITHNISATGKRFYDSASTLPKQAWEWAKIWAASRQGFNGGAISQFTSSIVTVPSTPYNYIVTESVDESAGSVSITETWVLAGEVAKEDFTVAANNSLEDNKNSVTIEGTITGLKGDSTSAYDNAVAYFASVPALAFNRAQTYSGLTLNPIALTSTITKSPRAGTIQYSYGYDTRPANLISGAKSEVISIIDSNQADVFAQIVIPGRTEGPLLQDINTVQAAARALNVEIVVAIPTGGIVAMIAAKPDISDFVSAVEGTLLPAFQIFKEQDEETWNPLQGRYNRQIRWVYER